MADSNVNHISLSLTQGTTLHGFIRLSSEFKDEDVAEAIADLMDLDYLEAFTFKKGATQNGGTKWTMFTPELEEGKPLPLFGWLQGSATPKATKKALLSGKLSIAKHVPKPASAKGGRRAWKAK